MSVEFTTRLIDLRRALREIKVNRGSHSERDFVDILVSECAATIRSIGTETEIPIHGKQTGSVRLPLRSLDSLTKVLPSFKKKELAFVCEQGLVKVGTWSLKHPDIELGRIPNQRLTIPIDLTVLDTLALAEILAPDEIVDQGLRARVEAAIETRSISEGEAINALQPLAIPELELRRFIDEQIRIAGARLKKALEAG